MQTSDFLAVVAIVLSTFSLVNSWRQVARDVGRLRLKVEYDDQSPNGTIYLMLTNIGRRPVTVDFIEIFTTDRKYLPVQEADFSLRESEAREIKIPLSGYIEYKPQEIKAVRVVDTYGNVYRISTDPMWRKWRRTGHLKLRSRK
jgi:hypothetical protein